MAHVLHLALLALVVIREGQHAKHELRVLRIHKRAPTLIDPLPIAPFCYYLVELVGQLMN
jgi:hypothetical protein